MDRTARVGRPLVGIRALACGEDWPVLEEQHGVVVTVDHAGVDLTLELPRLE